MKIYVVAECITFDQKGANGGIYDIKVFLIKKDALSYVQDKIDKKRKIGFLREYEGKVEIDVVEKDNRGLWAHVEFDAWDGERCEDHYEYIIKEFNIISNEQERTEDIR